MSSPEKRNYFQVLQRFKPDYSPNYFTQYESERTGMKVVVIDQKGPKVSGYFVLATEILDDSGAPHTLEHLCFMGSRNYQYKGFLDKLATRAYSHTNAWTSTDHTAYTLYTAGWAGFAQILPVYLEHIIDPTLTDAGCYTEVYHVDGTGNDAGVVYSEMQGVQNKSSELIDLKCRRLLYPEGIGFRYETGGMMEQLRVLTAERIRAFHRKMYQPKNLCLIITGEVDHDNMLQILNVFESTVLDVIPSPNDPFRRPWMESQPIPPLERSIVEKVEFPEADESFGEIEIRFLGPDCSDTLLSDALDVVLLYLAGSSATILENTLVEKEHLTSAVYYSTSQTPRTEISFTLTSVATEKLEQVERRFFEVLKEAMQNEIDVEYMQECVRRQRRSWKFSTESSVSPFAHYVICDFLFGKRDGSTLRHVASLHEYDELEKWHDHQWRAFIKQWISDAPHVSILGVPSSKLATKLKEDEQSRIAERKRALGEEGLKKLAEKLEEAKAANDKPIPQGELTKFEIPGVESIPFIKTTTAKSGLALSTGRPNNRIQQLVDADAPDSPLFIHFEHVASNFIQIFLNISTTSVPAELRPLLAVYMQAYFNLPVLRNGEKVPFEQVIVELERDTVSYNMDIGHHNPEMLIISFQAEPDKYDAIISYITELSWESIFDVERLKAITTRLLSDVPDAKRNGSRMVDAVQTMVSHTQESIVRAMAPLTRALYLKCTKRQLEQNPEVVVARMEIIRKQLFRFENFRIFVIADMDKLRNPSSAWGPFVSRLDVTQPLSLIIQLRDRLKDVAKNPGTMAHLVPMTTIDSSFVLTSAKGLDSYNHPKLPALLVTIAYMNAVEGPLWVAIRGTGLAYGSRFLHDVDTGLLQFQVYRSPNVYRAFEEGKKIVENHLSGAEQFDPHMALEGAISSIVLDFVNEETTQASTALASFVRQVIRGLPSDYQEKLLRKVREIGIEEIKEILRDFILPLFTPGKSDIIIACGRVLEGPIKKGFEGVGYKPEVRSLKFFEDDYGLKLEGGEDDEDEDGDEDEEAEESGSDDSMDNDDEMAN
ncbi:zinc metalloprotease [Histoplasma capsulatum var. duboisii H88]|uniref:Zinc metalloprotease n=1 Tax=Ajellomyces capsulatus (strain H88) TaxID=544711 RepID=F0UIR7_AJEC8|nr:zinc metalloprotease [Histoplasma capsulatum var. duboisii H88]QSS56270.1 zinc metalloprotease [Histoplasma capsulatum var. duboisii H88]